MDSYIDLFESVACKQTYRMKAGVDAVVEASTKDLQAQLDAANAHIAEMVAVIEMDIRKTYGNLRLEGLLAKTPAQSLAKVKADAVRTLLDDSSNWDSRIDGELYFTSSSIAAHADKIEEGV